MALTQSERQQLQFRLEKRKAILLDELQTGVQRLRTESAGDGGIPDTGDLSAADLNTSVNAGELARDDSELREVESALERLPSPEFGLCVECGQPVGFPRLSAYPTAQRCMPCQELHERRQANPHPRTL
ncbi:MAG: TraR/DksA family transcriptional regulator [Burkholderiales bacterium]